MHFLNANAVAVSQMSITGGETIPTVAIVSSDTPAAWSVDADGRPIFRIDVAEPGDFSNYTLTLISPALDRYYQSVQFSFKALCDSDLDCEPIEPPCPPESGDKPNIDYLAKDFNSFVGALSDFSALRYPDWHERSEADFGVMFMELLASAADDLSYMQDRIYAESSLDTATQRRSIVRHARLVDYEPRPATIARVLLQFTVTGMQPVPSGIVARAIGADGQAVDFETGTGLIDPQTGVLQNPIFPTSFRWNDITPYYWADEQRFLPAGATSLWVTDHGRGFYEGMALLIDTQGRNQRRSAHSPGCAYRRNAY